MKFKSLLLALCVSGCSALGLLSPAPVYPVSRPLQYLPGSSFDPSVINGLSNEDRINYYNSDYGLQYLPVNVLLSLKRADTNSVIKIMDEMFFEHPERFGLLPNYVNPNDPLPIGISRSTDINYVPMAGILCAACHTTMISNNKNQFFLVDGGSSRFQIDVFLGEMLKSVIATLLNPVEFEAFYDRYQIRAGELNSNPADKSLAPSIQTSIITSNTTALEAALKTLPQHQSGKTTTLTSAPYPTSAQLSTRTGMYVYLTRRFLYLFSLAKYGTNPAGSTVAASGPGRANPWQPTKSMLADKYLSSKNTYKIAGGPINIPFMWDHNRQHWVFLLGNTNSMVERNMAQSIALLADFNPTTFETTTSIKRLEAVSQYARKAKPPTWPENILGPIDQDLATQGKAIFKDQCLSCHDPQFSNIATASSNYNYMDVGTDPEYYYGQTERFDNKDLFKDILTPFMTYVKGVASINEGIADVSVYEQGRTPVIWKGPTSNAIIAKPLMGVWATPPYLHNGSVPTIRDLLNPSFMRPTVFHIGGYVYDTHNLGYTEDPTLPYGFDFHTHCLACDGNLNTGHEYGTQLSSAEKEALIEFLKSYDIYTSF